MNEGIPVTGYQPRLKAGQTHLMRDRADGIEGPLSLRVIALLNRRGLKAAAKELKVSKGTLHNWLPRLGIRVERVALLESQELRVVEKE